MLFATKKSTENTQQQQKLELKLETKPKPKLGYQSNIWIKLFLEKLNTKSSRLLLKPEYE